MKKIFFIGIIFIGLFFVKNVLASEIVSCPDFVKVDGYRLFFGKNEYDWIDVNKRNNQSNLKYYDESNIIKVICADYDEVIYIEKENTFWALFDYSDIMKAILIQTEIKDG